MALSGHKTPQAARLYVKRTETQRVTAARKRRAWIESSETVNTQRSKVRMKPLPQSQNERAICFNLLKNLVSPVGIEPTTL